MRGEAVILRRDQLAADDRIARPLGIDQIPMAVDAQQLVSRPRWPSFPGFPVADGAQAYPEEVGGLLTIEARSPAGIAKLGGSDHVPTRLFAVLPCPSKLTFTSIRHYAKSWMGNRGGPLGPLGALPSQGLSPWAVRPWPSVPCPNNCAAQVYQRPNADPLLPTVVI
jgi:hypothetical protein